MTIVQRIIPGSGGQTENIELSQLRPGETYFEEGVMKTYQPTPPTGLTAEQVMKALPAELPPVLPAKSLPEVLAAEPTPIRVPKPSGVDQTTITPRPISVRPGLGEARQVVGEAERVEGVRQQIREIESAQEELAPIKSTINEQLIMIRRYTPSTLLDYTVDGVTTQKSAGEIRKLLEDQKKLVSEAESSYSTQLSSLKKEAKFKPVRRERISFEGVTELGPPMERGVSATENVRVFLSELKKAGIPFDPDSPGVGMIAYYEDALRTGLVTLPEAMLAFGLKPVVATIQRLGRVAPSFQPVVSETELLAPKPSPVKISQLWESPSGVVQAIPSLEAGYKTAMVLETIKDVVKISEAIETALNLRALKEVKPVTKLLKEKEGVYRAISEIDISDAYPYSDPNVYKIVQKSRLTAKPVPAELVTAFPEGEIAVPIKGVVVKGKPEIGVTALVKESAITGSSKVLKQAITEVPEVTGAVIKEVVTPGEIRRAVLLQESDEIKGLLLQSEFTTPVPFKAKAPPVEVAFGLESASFSFIRQPDLDIYGLSAAFKKGKVTVTPPKPRVTGITRPYEAVSEVVTQSTRPLQEEVIKAAAGLQLTKSTITQVTAKPATGVITKSSVDVATITKQSIRAPAVITQKEGKKIKPVDITRSSVKTGLISEIEYKRGVISPTREATGLKPSEDEGFKPFVISIPKVGDITEQTTEIAAITIPTITPPPPIKVPTPPIIPFVPRREKAPKRKPKKPAYKTRREYAYQPSVESILLDKRGAKPKKKVFTGFEERPIPITKRSKASPFKATLRF